MSRIDARKPDHSRDGLTRRDFLHAGSLAMLGLGLPGLQASEARAASGGSGDRSCIMLFLVGGPSQLDTWDMKPDAPAEIRGPFRPIQTRVPGLQISEIFPKMAGLMDRVSLVRTLNHQATAVHDTGHQLLQTGRLFSPGVEHPHVGAVVSRLQGRRGELPANVVLPRPIGPTGGNMPHGQDAGYLGEGLDPFVLHADPNAPDYRGPGLPAPGCVTAAGGSADARLAREVDRILSSRAAREAFDLSAEPDSVRDRYGRTRFGQSCLLARRLVERGVRFVTVNMFDTVFHELTWDIHGSAPFSPIDCYKNEVGPNFDNAYSALLEDLDARGLLDATMVVATGEFGRTPRINAAGGRDHHPACWTALFAGGPVQGGRVVGESDAIAAAPSDRPVSPGEFVATIYEGLGVSLDTELPGPQGQPIRLVDHGVEPIRELF